MRRFIALVLCIALCFGLLAMPSYALDATHIYTACGFWSFLNRSIFSGIYDVAHALWGLGSDYYGGGRSTSYNGGGRPDADLQSAYNSYVSDLNVDYGTSCFGLDGYKLPVNIFRVNNGGNGSNTTLPIGTITYALNHLSADGNFKDNNIVLWFKDLVCPVDGYYTLLVDKSVSGQPLILDIGNTWRAVSRTSCVRGYPLIQESSYGILSLYASTSGFSSLSLDVSYWVEPAFYSLNSIAPVSSRAPSILTSIMQTNTTNNAYYIGTKDTSGAVTNVYTTNIFNEETKVFTVPGETPVEHTVTNWNYDYSTRTYNCTDGTNNYVVTYGDDYITVTVPDGSGGTISTNYYYVHQTPVPVPAVPGSDTTFPDSSSDNYEDDPNTTGGFFSTVWKAFKDGLASLIAGIIKGLFKGIKALIDGITFVFSDLVSGFFGFVTSFFNSFGTGPGSVGQFFGGGVVDLG